MNFQRLQQDFCDLMRDPDAAVPPELDPDRLELYRSLVYRNIESFLAQSFVQVKARTGTARWHRLVRSFIRSGSTTTPIFHELPGLFALWLREQELDTSQPTDALLEQMAHFAWARHELDFSTDQWNPDPTDTVPADLLTCRLDWSPLAWPLRYSWPVHQMRPGPVEPEPVCLMLWRDRDDRVQWQLCAPASLMLAEKLRQAEDGQTGAEAIAQLVAELPDLDADTISEQCEQTLQHFCSQGWIAPAHS